MVKNPALSLLWLWSLLWGEFDPWPGNFHMSWVQPIYIYTHTHTIYKHLFKTLSVCICAYGVYTCKQIDT